MNTILKRIGGGLMLIGAVSLLATIVGMVVAFRGAHTGAHAGLSASGLAAGMSSSLIGAEIGGPLFTVGLILFLIGWLRGRKAETTTTVS